MSHEDYSIEDYLAINDMVEDQVSTRRRLDWRDTDPGTWSENDALHAGLLAIETASQIAADTMDHYNDTGEFDEALAALESVGITPTISASEGASS